MYWNQIDFSIQWEDNAIDQDQAEGFLDSLEYSWDVEVDDLGWNAPTRYQQPFDDGSWCRTETTATQGPIQRSSIALVLAIWRMWWPILAALTRARVEDHGLS